MNRLTLDASPSSDLDWDLSEEGPYHLDFGWQNKPLNPHNPAHFNACMLAVEEFAKKAPEAGEVVLLASNGEFHKLLEGDFDPLFAAQLMSEYLHRLASALPEEAIPTLLLTINETQDFGEMVIRLCRRRFEHFQLKFTDRVIPVEGEARVAVALPSDEMYDPAHFNALFSSLEGFICIPEELLNEHWDGLDQIIVDPDLMSDTGRRMLLGFEAAGGEALKFCL